MRKNATRRDSGWRHSEIADICPAQGCEDRWGKTDGQACDRGPRRPFSALTLVCGQIPAAIEIFVEQRQAASHAFDQPRAPECDRRLMGGIHHPIHCARCFVRMTPTSGPYHGPFSAGSDEVGVLTVRLRGLLTAIMTGGIVKYRNRVHCVPNCKGGASRNPVVASSHYR